MRFAFYADTPYQLMNCINIVWHDISGCRGKGDLYLLMVQERYPDTLAVLQREKLFKNIYICNKYPPKYKWYSFRAIAHDISRAAELFFPEKAVRDYVQEGITQRNYYDVIVASTVLVPIIGLIELNKNAPFWMFDDGSGSYYGDFISHYVNKKPFIL